MGMLLEIIGLSAIILGVCYTTVRIGLWIEEINYEIRRIDLLVDRVIALENQKIKRGA